MLVTPDWTLVFNPRTGSRSLCAGLKSVGFKRVQHVHTEPEEVVGERVVGVIRHPVTWVWSYYYTSQKWPMRFEDWLDQYHDKQVGVHWARGRLNAYRDVITEYWIYERGIDGLLGHLGYPNRHLPDRGYKPKPIAPYFVPRLLDLFREEWELYEELLSAQRYE